MVLYIPLKLHVRIWLITSKYSWGPLYMNTLCISTKPWIYTILDRSQRRNTNLPLYRIYKPKYSKLESLMNNLVALGKSLEKSWLQNPSLHVPLNHHTYTSHCWTGKCKYSDHHSKVLHQKEKNFAQKRKSRQLFGPVLEPPPPCPPLLGRSTEKRTNDFKFSIVHGTQTLTLAQCHDVWASPCSFNVKSS